MPRYRTLTGVVLTSICGEYVLVAARDLRGRIPSFTQVNESSAFLWRCLETGADPEELLRRVSEEFEIEDPASAGQAIDAFITKMLNAGFLAQEEE